LAGRLGVGWGLWRVRVGANFPGHLGFNRLGLALVLGTLAADLLKPANR